MEGRDRIDIGRAALDCLQRSSQSPRRVADGDPNAPFSEIDTDHAHSTRVTSGAGSAVARNEGGSNRRDKIEVLLHSMWQQPRTNNRRFTVTARRPVRHAYRAWIPALGIVVACAVAVIVRTQL